MLLLYLYIVVKIKCVSQTIKRVRIKKSLAQEKLTTLADISIATHVKIESSTAKEPTIITVIKIADAFNISIDELAGRNKEYK